MNHRLIILTLLLLAANAELLAQETTSWRAVVLDADSKAPLSEVFIQELFSGRQAESNRAGQFEMVIPTNASVSLRLVKEAYETTGLEFKNAQALPDTLFMTQWKVELNAAEIESEQTYQRDLAMPAVQGVGIYRGMKSEVIRMDAITANLSTNNSRQVYNRIAGLNIWENDGAGIQLGIGARGLSPNRTSNFNVRQNLYDISADALGYPESYYSPALQSVDRIEIVRGAAALQYGTQFGGLLNFTMKSPIRDSVFVQVEQGVGSFGLNDSIAPAIASSTTFVSAGAANNRSGIYGSYQFKTGSSWRANENYDVHTAYLVANHDISTEWRIKADITHMQYLAQQPGGLTDEAFEENPRQSTRERNWFKVDWNIASFLAEYEPNQRLKMQTRTFGLLASREALGFLGQTQRPDPEANRDLISGTFKNIGNETRMLFRREWKNGFFIATTGFRLYRGYSETTQGLASDGDGPDFNLVEDIVDDFSDFSFPNKNAAAFAQAIIPITERLSITPGIRYEYIETQAEGSFRNVIRDAAGNIIEDTLIATNQARFRDFALGGIGLSYKWGESELYANVVQNYRAINFTDIQVRNLSLVIDPDIQDESGFTFDLGYRTRIGSVLQIDASLFALHYDDRIGEYFTTDNLNRAVRYRTNVSDARIQGAEMYAEYKFSHLFLPEEEKTALYLFVNGSLIDAFYLSSDISAFDGKRVELVPEYTLRTGLKFEHESFGASFQYNYVDDQFSDATNVGTNPNFPSTPNAVDGIIPAYQVMDLSVSYSIKRFRFSASVNNLANAAYFTRRASGYPGPGIIPSQGRAFYFGVRFGV